MANSKYTNGLVYCKAGTHYVKLGIDTFTKSKDGIWCKEHCFRVRTTPKRGTAKAKLLKIKRI
jgi:hypothetical protein